MPRLSRHRAAKACRPVLLAVAVVGLAAATGRADDPAAEALQRAEASQQQRIDLIRRLEPTVVSIFRVDSRNNELSPGSGSGVIISSDGYALTNFHVTQKTQTLRVGLPGGKVLKAHLCGVDRTGDIALIKIDADEPLPCAEMGSSGELVVGQWVVALGNPFMLATDFRPTVSLGVVSGLHRYLEGGGLFHKDLIYADAIQIDAALNPGNSGGPLFNLRGQLVGINGRIAPRRVRGMAVRRVNAGIGFAVPVDSIKMFLDEMKAGREVDRGYLGLDEVVPHDGGLLVKRIGEGTPAEIFGIELGDVVLTVDGAAVRDAGQMRNLLRRLPAGRRLNVELRRGHVTLTRSVQLAGIQSVAALRKAEIEAAGLFSRSLFREGRPDDEDDENDDDEGDDEDSDDAPPPQKDNGNPGDTPSPDAPPNGNEQPQDSNPGDGAPAPNGPDSDGQSQGEP
ncbi:MAG TPA: trypsin-like peptidase domain-containing protein [Phycisphaerae bacterium]|nr:PDZ domain-containing protein [Phycisphaerae bacterium]HOI53758.1 trypsin-like peptidase domain-containing protein [Phycisphaerae bacterium]